MNPTALAAALDDALTPHIVEQRWYGSSPATPRVIEVRELRPPWPGLIRVLVDAGEDRYQLVLGLVPFGADVGPVVATVHLDEGDAQCLDATVDAESAIALLRHITSAASAEEVGTARPITAEQSNSSVVYDERLILKVFRRLVGRNPEIEMTTGLARVGFTNIAEPLAVWQDGDDDLAILQPFLSGGVEGWALALTSVRDFLDQGGDPAEAGGDLAPEMDRLGEITATLHLALAEAFGATAGDARVWAADLRTRVGDASHPGVDSPAVLEVIDAAGGIADAGAAIRIHGDLHLGQVMRSDVGWYVLDFEGEPTRPVEERRRPGSPLRDVAGMLRSISYAAAFGSREGGASIEATESWERHNRAAFLHAYLRRMDGSALLPSDPGALRKLLHAFELDKAVYEVAYEQAHRPDWVDIPLAAVNRLLAAAHVSRGAP